LSDAALAEQVVFLKRVKRVASVKAISRGSIGTGRNSGITSSTMTLTTLDVAELDIASPDQTALNWYVQGEEEASKE
jgi:hypothetical protein